VSEDDTVSSDPLSPAENRRARIIMRDYERAAWLGKKVFLFLIVLPGALWAGWQFLKDVFHVR